MTAFQSTMDESYEKPWLTCQPCSDRLPMVLSGGNVHPPIQVPASITQYLRDYQRSGVRFLYDRFKEGEGGLLADDMGLGKTVQAIAFIAAVLQMKGNKEDKLRHCSAYIRNDVAPGIEVPSVNPVLIICPASLTDNWIYEFHVWGYFKINKITSANKLELINQAVRRECDVVIVTFETARTIINDLNSVDWTCILVDEVHRIKETKSQVSKALFSLHCKHRFGFTGTPFQNNMREIFCLLKWSSPETISRFNVSDETSRLMEQGLRSSATMKDCAEKSIAQFQFSEIRTRLMMRRTKDILAKHLPSKTDQIVFCELTEVQQNIYRLITQSTDLQNFLKKDGCNRKQPRKSQAGILFTYLHLLQKTANHVGLLAAGLSSKTNEVAKRVCEEALHNFAGLEGIPQKKWFNAVADVTMSGKMLVLSKLLPSFLERGDKILLFSYSTKILDLVQKYLLKMRFKFWRLDGSTPVDSRLSLVTAFNLCPNPAVFLLSTKAGGVGLNMTGANVVIIFDPNWNPAHDLQAQDRAYRLGQQRDVRVYRLLSTATIEEFVYLRQVFKQQLGTASMTDKNTRRYFDTELFGVKNLFSFREGSRSLTEELLDKQQKLELKLRLKLEAPLKDRLSKVSFSSSAIALSGQGIENEESRSGLTQLCEDVFQTSYSHAEMDERGDLSPQEESCDDESSDSVSSLLEKTSEVRHVVSHQNVVAPSKVEDIIADCAIRDVFERKINFFRPAFDCSMESEDIVMTNEQEERKRSRHAIMCRLKFNQFAERESLTAFYLAAKVVAMSAREKETFLKAHQEKLQNPWNRKRARLPSLPSFEVSTPSTSGVEGTSSVKIAKLDDLATVKVSEYKADVCSKPCILDHFRPSEFLKESKLQEDGNTSVTCPVDNPLYCAKEARIGAKSSSQLSDSSESSSSFEIQVQKDNPGISKEALKFVSRLHCNQSKMSARSTQSDPKSMEKSKIQSPSNKLFGLTAQGAQGGESNKPLSGGGEGREEDIRVVEDDMPVVDEATGCSMSVIAFVDSLYESTKRLPSPKKKPSGLPSVEYDAQGVSIACSSTGNVNAGKSAMLKSETRPAFDADVDRFQKLIDCGKLKPNKDYCKL